MLTSLYHRLALSNTSSLAFWDSQQLSNMLTHQTSKETVSFLHHPFFLKLLQCLWSPVFNSSTRKQTTRSQAAAVDGEELYLVENILNMTAFWNLLFFFKGLVWFFFSPSWGNTQASHFQKVVPRFSNHERTCLSRWMLTHTMRPSRVSEVSTFNSDYLPCNISSIHSLNVVSPAFEQGGASF